MVKDLIEADFIYKYVKVLGKSKQSLETSNY